MIERRLITDRAEWLAWRRQDVTASAAAAILGVHPYVSAYGLWAEKTGKLDGEADPESPALRRGRLLEPVALQLLREERPEWSVDAGQLYLRDAARRLGATPDAFVIDPERGPGIVQVKTAEPSIFRREWRDRETGEVVPPVWIGIQAIIEAHLSGAGWAAIAALVVGYGCDLHIVDVPLHAGVLAKVYEAVAAFWAMVARGEAPDPDYKRDAGLLASLYAGDDVGTEIDLRADNRLPNLLAEMDQLGAGRRAADARLKEIKAEVLHKLGGASRAVLSDGILSVKTIRRGAYQVAPSSYPQITYRPYSKTEAA